MNDLIEHTEAGLTAALADLDPDMCYNGWLNVGMALHGWNVDKGEQVWETWSKEGKKHEHGNVAKQWNTFGSGVGTGLGTIYNMAAEARELRASDKPEWCNRWAHVRRKGFISLDSKTLMSEQGFNITEGWRVPRSSNGRVPTASRFVQTRDRIKKVQGVVYNATDSKDITTDRHQGTVVNTYKRHSLPVPATAYTEKGSEAIDVVKYFLNCLCGSDGRADILTQWLAHQVQRPGVLLRWTPVIQTDEYDNKGSLRNILSRVLARDDVFSITAHRLKSGSNAWALGKSVAIIENAECLKVSFERSMARLDDLIVNDDIIINGRYAENHTNYIVFAGNLRTLPIPKGDSRYWLVRKNRFHSGDLAAEAGELMYAIEEHSTEIHKWLLEYPISSALVGTKPTADRFEQL